MTDSRWDVEVDVLVVGAGGCGLTAALAAKEQGVDVAVLEKLAKVSGNTGLSTGSVLGAGTKYQRAAGIEDSPEKMIEDLSRQAGPHEMMELTRVLAHESASLVEWLIEVVGVRMGLITDYRHVGHTVPRLHAPPSRKGKDLIEDLLAAAKKKDIPVAVSNPVTQLVPGAENEVIGAVIKSERTGEYRLKAKKIILANNGFAAHRGMVSRFCPDIAGAPYFGAEGSTGEAILWGEELGAALANIGAYQAYAAVSYPYGSIVSWTTVEMGGIMVDHQGRRFGDESLGYSGFATAVMANTISNVEHPHLAFVICDARIRDYTASHEEEFRELVQLGGAKEWRDLADMTRLYGHDFAHLSDTIEGYNAAARGETKDPLGRRGFGFAPLEPPYVACQVTPGLFHTQGGLKINPLAQVLRPDGAIIGNLFAGGGAAAGISGLKGPAGYSSGNGLLTALGLGRIAGRAAALEVRAGK
ncbi:MAG: FAD-dependent oxidoreductase [Thermodesulfobacteriota bacterium]